MLAGDNVLNRPKESHSPPRNITFQYVFNSGGEGLSLEHLLRTWWAEKIPYAKLT
jgi:hypothetical protein